MVAVTLEVCKTVKEMSSPLAERVINVILTHTKSHHTAQRATGSAFGNASRLQLKRIKGLHFIYIFNCLSAFLTVPYAALITIVLVQFELGLLKMYRSQLL
jgi:hypothetical protein